MTRQRKLVLGSVAALSWLGLLSYAIVSGAHRCRGLELIPEPADWRSFLHREPKGDRLVISGLGTEANGRMRGEELVAAFHRVLPPNTAQQR
jgi:hypothetical protein